MDKLANVKKKCPYCQESFSWNEKTIYSFITLFGEDREFHYCPHCKHRVLWTMPVFHPEKAYWAKSGLCACYPVLPE